MQERLIDEGFHSRGGLFPFITPVVANTLSCVQRLPGPAGAKSLATALAQLTQLKELKVGLHGNNIGAGPRGAEGMAPGIADLSASSSLKGKRSSIQLGEKLS